MTDKPFFSPGRTYARASGPTAAPRVFRCDQVSAHPETGAPHAFGWISRATEGATWQETSLSTFAWERGWEDVTPTPEEPGPAAVRNSLPFSAEAVEDIAQELLEEAGLIWPESMVFYHGEKEDFRGLYFADVCECGSCGKEDVQSYVLRTQNGIPVLRNVPREDISMARIA